MRLVIDQTWDGAPLDRSERATVLVVDQGHGLRVTIEAPWHRDPPPPGPPGPTDGLWEHEVVELFVAGEGEPVPYTELEVSPYGHHLLLTFVGVREATARALPADVHVTRDRDGWRASAWIPAEHLPPRPWRVNACAIHGLGPARRYLSAVPLGGAAPDFHQPERFREMAEERGF